MTVVTEVINFMHELDMLECHLEEHSKFIDRIVVVESEITYSGMKKPLYFEENKHRFAKFNVEHEIVPVSLFEQIPASYEEKDHKKWFDARRRNREKQQDYLYQKYRKDSDYVCNTDADEVWSHKKWDIVQEMMEEEHCYIAPGVRFFMYFVDHVGRKQEYWRITKSDQPTHRRIKGTKRGATRDEIGWHFSACFKDPYDLWLKGVGLAQSIGVFGWKNVPDPAACAAIISDGMYPFLNKAIEPKKIMSNTDRSWLPPYMQRNHEKFPWLDEKYRAGVRVHPWKLRD